LKEAVQRKLGARAASRATAAATASSDEPLFAEKLSCAVKERLKNHPNTPSKLAENAKREGERYLRKPRKPTKGE
jgi:hypothetical protein